MLPYRMSSKIRQTIKRADDGQMTEDDVLVVFGHFDVKGAPLRPGVPDKGGVEMREDLTAFIGHYHHPAILGETTFVGAPFHRNWADVRTDVPRGAMVVEFENGEVLASWRVENPHTPFFEVVDLVMQKREVSPTEAMTMFASNYQDPERAFLRVLCAAGDESMVKSLTHDFRNVRIVPVKPGMTISGAQRSLSALELKPDKILTQQVLRDETTSLKKKKLLRIGRDILGAVDEG